MPTTPSVPAEHLSRDDRIRKLHYDGKSIRQIAREVGCGVATVHRAVHGDDLIGKRYNAGVEEARDAISALRRAMHAAKHGDVTGMEDPLAELAVIDLEEIAERLWELSEQNSLDGPA